MAEDKFAVEYFSSAFSLASSFYDDMSHQIVFGPIYEELIPLGLAKKNKNRGRRSSFVKGQVFVREYSHVRHKSMVEVRRIRLHGELDDATSERLISSIGHAEEGLISSIGE